jgi:hypothetical protein
MKCNEINQTLANLPSYLPGSVEAQSHEIYKLLENKDKVFYRPCDDLPLQPAVKTLLESKGYYVIEQIKYHLKWVDGVAVRGAIKRRVYYIRKKCC